MNHFRTWAVPLVLPRRMELEIPEAPHGGSLYRILFLAALLLFAITFLVNTAAEPRESWSRLVVAGRAR